MWHCSQMFGIESLIDRERGGAGTRLLVRVDRATANE